MKEIKLSELPFEYQGLIRKAREMGDMAYAPYSKFRVGAALLDAQGRVFSGCNIENSSSGAAICAERVAVANAIAQGSREFVAIAITTSSAKTIMPCGICRQTLSEFVENMKILCATDEGDVRIYDLCDLFPEPFALYGV